MSAVEPAGGHVGVAGAGTMGAGIAGVALLGGFYVTLHDPDPAALARGRERVAAELDGGVARGRWSGGEAAAARGRLRCADAIEALAGCGLVIEAAPERLELKRRLFEALEGVCGPDAVLATNTSSLAVGDIAEGASAPERVCGMHFFNPPSRMRLVEVVAARSSGEQALQTATDAARRMGRTPLRCADSPGFIVNRCNRPFALESLQMLGEGVADVPAIDAALRERGGFPMGPFELVDLIGVDVNLEVARSFYGQRPVSRWRPHPLQERLVAQGRLGRKTGSGFYEYGEGGRPLLPRAPAPEARLADAIVRRLVATLVNEACFAAGEGVAAPAEIDTAMRLGLNHPRGPFEWGERVGAAEVLATLDDLAAADPERYEPAPVLRRWVAGEEPR